VTEPSARRWTTLHDLLAWTYEEFAENIAVSDSRETLRYGELGDRVRRITSHLARYGLRPGDRVGTVLGNRHEYVALEQAMAYGGFVRVAAIPRLNPREVAQIFSDAEPAIVFADSAWLETANDEFFSSLSCPLVVIDAAPGESRPRFDEFLLSAVEDVAQPTLDDPAWIAYTSGTTGTPKGVIHTHRSLTSMVRNLVAALPPLGPSDVAVHTAPWPHMRGTFGWAVHSVGGRNELLDGFEPAQLVETISQLGATVTPLVPTQLNRLTEYLAEHRGDVASVRVLPYAGSAIAPDRLEEATHYFGPALTQLYGLAEVLMPITILHAGDHVGDENEVGLARFNSAGRVGPDTEVEIRDHENVALPSGEPGEIVVRSARATSGYWRQPDATAELFDEGGFCHTGDVGLLDKEGYLFIVDRKKDMIVTGGFNVYPREVENVLSTLPAVLEVAVVSAPDEKWGETIVAVVVVREGATLTLNEVQEHCRAQLASYKVPRRLELVDEIPKGSTGKINKRALSDRFWGDRRRRVGG